ncbi:MAG: exo-alpha-sialidase [Deferribacteres bacterium]|nr:exo-alpha-sialidase [Deferribacteres bacterium]
MELSLPEKNISGVSLCLCRDDVVISAKNGNKVTLLKSRDLENWERSVFERGYKDRTTPVVSHLSDSLSVFMSRNYQPYLRSLETDELVSLKTPYLKKGVVSGHPVAFENLYLVPGYGIPYGCKLVSPVLFEYEEGQWFLRSFISISEDFGAELRHTVLALKGGVLYAFIGSSFPFYHIFMAKSYDGGKTWTKPRMTGISGMYPVAEVWGNTLVLACYNRDMSRIELFAESVDGKWRKVKTHRVEDRVLSLDGVVFKGSLILTAALSSGEAVVVSLNL